MKFFNLEVKIYNFNMIYDNSVFIIIIIIYGEDVKAVV